MSHPLRFLLAVFIAAMSSQALATTPTCVMDERAGYSVTARGEPAGAPLVSVSAGTVVEIFTMANDAQGWPWVLLRDPANIDMFYGWVERRAVQCR